MNAPDKEYRGWRYTTIESHATVPVVVVIAGGTERALVLPASVRPIGLQEGFEWGYHGAGPSALAFALLFDVTGDRALAWRMHVWFRWGVVASFPAVWRITAATVGDWVERFRREERAEADDRLPAPHVVEGGAA